MPHVITCKVILDESMSSFEDATVHAYLEDVSALDGRAVVVDRGCTAKVSHESGSANELEMTLRATELDERARYIVRAHIAPHGARDVRPGDYVTTQSYPVLTAGHPSEVTVRLHEVK